MIFTTQKQLRKAKHITGMQFRCGRCKAVKEVQVSGGTGYGYDSRFPDRPVCYECCGELEKQDMIETGRGCLYLTCEPARKMRDERGHAFTPATYSNGVGRKTEGKLTNWPGTLEFRCHTRVGRHNIAGTRYDAWFTGPDGKKWHGVMLGENTQICRCRRLKHQ